MIDADDLPGDLQIITFFSTAGSSASSSRLVLRRLDELLERLRPERRARVHVLAVSLDSENGESLALQADRLGIARSGWTVATAPRAQRERLAASLGVVGWHDASTGFGHTLATTIVASGRVADRFLGVAEWSVADLLGAVSSAMRPP